MNHLLKSLIFLLLSIGFLVGMVVWVRSLTFLDTKNKDDCDSKKDLKNGNCTIFEDSICRKGKCDTTPCNETNYTCTGKSSPGPLILMVASIICFIVSIVFFVLNFTSKHKELTVHHEYGSSLPSSE